MPVLLSQISQLGMIQDALKSLVSPSDHRNAVPDIHKSKEGNTQRAGNVYENFIHRLETLERKATEGEKERSSVNANFIQRLETLERKAAEGEKDRSSKRQLSKSFSWFLLRDLPTGVRGFCSVCLPFKETIRFRKGGVKASNWLQEGVSLSSDGKKLCVKHETSKIHKESLENMSLRRQAEQKWSSFKELNRILPVTC